MKLKIFPKAGGCMEIEIEPGDLQLETVCPGTVGEGCRLGRTPGGTVCPICDGVGAVVSPVGYEILAFVVRHAAKYRAAMKAGASARGESALQEILPAHPKSK